MKATYTGRRRTRHGRRASGAAAVALAACCLVCGSAQAASFGPDLSTATANNPYTCSYPFAYGVRPDGCTAVDLLSTSMSLVLPDPIVNGNQSGLVTAIHVRSAVTEPAQFVVIEYAADPRVADSTIVSGVSALSQQVTLKPGINNFNTNLPVDYVLSSSGIERWSAIGLTVPDGYPIPGQLGGSISETGLVFDNGEPLTSTVADITIPPHSPQISGYQPMRLLMSGDVTITTLATSVTVPTMTGTATQGQTLTEANGTWTGSPTSYSYQWVDCDSLGNNCQMISGATNQTYTLTGNDVGHTVRVQERAVTAGGPSNPANSLPTAVVQGSGVNVPTLTASAAKGFANRTLGQRFGNAFKRRSGFKSSCSPNSRTQIGCNVAWRSGTYHYSGLVTVFYSSGTGTPSLSSRLKIKRVTQKCFMHPRRGCRSKTYS
jgi:hypothetical protein